ncbi:MAG: hypothetical protein RLZ72_525, partial [Actinomycetota bacterium]
MSRRIQIVESARHHRDRQSPARESCSM